VPTTRRFSLNYTVDRVLTALKIESRLHLGGATPSLLLFTPILFID
jgi:hypothetical protein